MKLASVNCTTIQHVTWLDQSDCSYSDPLAVFNCWLPDEPEMLPYLRSVLHPDELARADRYRREYDRNRFTYARGTLRTLLGKYTNQHPARVQFVIGANKKPALKDAVNLHFNVSHSGSRILVAIGKVNVGVDVEKMTTDFPYKDILPHSFNLVEQRSIRESADAQGLFYQLWTRKEALVKATGKGMDDDFSLVPSLDGKHHVAPGLIGLAGNWTVHGFSVADGHAGAVAYLTMPQLPNFYHVHQDSLTR